MAENNTDEVQEGGDEPKGASKKKLVIFLLLAVVLLAGVGGGTTYFLLMGGEQVEVAEGETEESEEVSSKEAFYMALGDPFIVDFNVDGKQRFLQIYISVMARDKEPLSALETHLPLIRNNLNLVIGQQEFAALSTSEGKQKLKDEALVSVQQVMKAETGKDVIESILFTNFVIQ
ncbi:flagellar basal body-associated FliL family protein [Aestuariirhabdus sp. LZHN29]|uniref:flagellar basal body-associated FliL family protein n=1 Tax=Aestuariirhabdus sp. LZHN29 TaxID=3417462 RepID=UPI003CED4935